MSDTLEKLDAFTKRLTQEMTERAPSVRIPYDEVMSDINAYIPFYGETIYKVGPTHAVALLIKRKYNVDWSAYNFGVAVPSIDKVEIVQAPEVEPLPSEEENKTVDDNIVNTIQ